MDKYQVVATAIVTIMFCLNLGVACGNKNWHSFLGWSVAVAFYLITQFPGGWA